MARKCRSCKQLKWGSDPCPNPDCGRNTARPAWRVKLSAGNRRPITLNVHHGFHGEVVTADLARVRIAWAN